MNRQIGELTGLVLALTQQISSNPREGNGLNTVTTRTNSRSDNWVRVFLLFPPFYMYNKDENRPRVPYSS